MATSSCFTLALPLMILALTRACRGEVVHNTVNATMDCIPQNNQQEINRLVGQFASAGDWEELRSGLEGVLDGASAAHAELRQHAGQGASPFSVAAAGHQDLVSLLLCSGLPADLPDCRGRTLLHGAASSHSDLASLVWLLLALGADVNKVDLAEDTPLLRAAFSGHLAVVERLVQAGADTSATDALGRTALDLASNYNRTDVAQYLRQLQG